MKFIECLKLCPHFSKYSIILFYKHRMSKRGSGLEMTHFFNNKQVLMENVSFQDLTPKLFRHITDNRG